MVKNLAIGTGRRKTSVARVYLRAGKGQVTVNGKTPEDYFNTDDQRLIVTQALDVTDNSGKFDIVIRVNGGGIASQAGATRHALARALTTADESNNSSLKANGFLTRDPRMKERKKYGQPKARKKFQFSKR